MEWINTEERLPDDDTLVLAAFKDGEVWPCFREDGTWRYVTAEPVESNKVTYWMHMPAGPGRAAG
jgi:hypothetical protein